MDSQRSRKRPPLRLPFTGKKRDIGEWTYDNREGLLITLILYLILAIAFVFGKILISQSHHSQGVYIDLSDIETAERVRDELLQEVEQKQNFDWASISNRASNENSLDERVQDDRGSDVEQLSSSAQSVQEQMDANRQAYKDAIESIEQMRESGKEQSSGDSSSQRRDEKIEGSVTVSYSFANPVRHAVDLVVPAYRCQGGGEVVLEVGLNSRGVVVSTKWLRGGDSCMQQAAIAAAKSSRFNTENSAPQNHIGTITYIYIPQ